MATKQRYVEEQLEELTDCCICAGTYKDPKILPCIHTFCLECLRKIAAKTDKSPGDKMACPICRKDFDIPQDGIAGLPKNFFMERLVEIAKVSNPSSNRMLCEACIEENEQGETKMSSAQMFCKHCRQMLCSECCKHHRKFRATKNHDLLSLDSHDFEKESMLTDTLTTCELHKQELLNLYCTDCREVLCSSCILDRHQDHLFCGLNSKAKNFRDEILNHVSKTSSYQNETSEKLISLEKEKNSFLQKMQTLQTSVITARDALKEMADQHADLILNELESMKNERLKKIEIEKEDIDRHMTYLNSFGIFCKKIASEGSDSDICRTVGSLGERAKELEQLHKDIGNRSILLTSLEFKKNTFGNDVNVVGKLEDADRYKVEPALLQTIRANDAFDNNRAIRGVTILGQDLFIIQEAIPEIKVFDSETLELRHTRQLSKLFNPGDMISCERNNCLYIISWNLTQAMDEILKIDRNGNILITWTIERAECRFSATYDSNILVTFYAKHALKEYTTDGKLFCEVKLPDCIKYPTHAVKCTNGNFIICFSDAHGYDLAEVNGGVVVKTFTGIREATGKPLKVPRCIVVDQTGHVMIADQENNRVLLFNPDMTFQKELVSEKHGLISPTRLFLDETRRRLFVGLFDNSDYRILVFRL